MTEVIGSILLAGVAIFVTLVLGIRWGLGLAPTSATMVVAACISLVLAVVLHAERNKSYMPPGLRGAMIAAGVGTIGSTVMLVLYYVQRSLPLLIASAISAVGLLVLVVIAYSRLSGLRGD